MRRRIALIAAAVLAASAVACSPSVNDPSTDWGPVHVTSIPKPAPLVMVDGDGETIPDAELPELSYALSEALFESAPAVIVATEETLAEAAESANVPLPILVLPAEPSEADIEALAAESERLGALGWISRGVALPDGFPEPYRIPDSVEEIPARSVLVVGDPAPAQQLLAATGWPIVGVEGDPRGSAEAISALTDLPDESLIVVGDLSGDLEWQVATARTGVLLPTGTQLAAPDVLYVALYGHPSGPALGVLGEQQVPETILRAEEHAAPYRDLVDVPVVPALEIIATVASAGSQEDNSYSRKSPISELEPLIDAAGEAGMYVVLDLQPGRTDFLTQAKLYEELLLRPYVGLALDPEWRLGPNDVHLVRIGQVDTAEVNTVVEWLADLTRENNLPQKILILHSFQNRMITDIENLDVSRSELAIAIHVDGQGAQGAKQTTWRTLRAYAPNVELWGWKNFYDEDTPAMLTPQQTINNVDPTPIFISYQ